jgi:hypothetical protein
MRLFTALSLVFLLTACATTYQPESFSGGFNETQLDKNVFRISFKGNGFTKADRAEDMALLRSAEISLKNGFSHFAIVDGKSASEFGTYTTPAQSTTTGSVSTYGNTAYGRANTRTTGGQSFLINKPSTTNTIVCFESKPEGNFFVYDAQFVFNSLSQKYGLKPDIK